MNKLGAAQTRLAALFQDRELFLRSGGQVRFLKISAKFQKMAAVILTLLVVAWVATAVVMLTRQAISSGERAEIARQQAEIAKKERKVAAYRDRVDNVAEDLNARQEYLEALTKTYLEPDAENAEAIKATTVKKPVSQNRATDIADELAALQRIRLRQDQFAEKLVAMASSRTARAEIAIRELGLNPSILARNTRTGMGGPFEAAPVAKLPTDVKDPLFLKLNTTLRRMVQLEQTLVTLPQSNPASIMMMSSGFGYRSDPFTGSGAMHSGLDFRGPVGTPILASARGVVSFVGTRSGYGNVVEVDHGHGIMTRYAHLSGFDTRVGHVVEGGEKIARMGSTGRSTGSHLHFEVRLNGQALNPRRFLEANTDVLTREIAGS